MRATVFLCILAALAWLVLFSPWTRWIVPFWPGMFLATGVLAGTALMIDRREWAGVCRFAGSHVVAGCVSAGLLYVIFLAGYRAVTWVLPGAAEQVQAIYGLSDQAPEWAVTVLLCWIGPAEEVFWRGFVQRRLARRWGAWSGLLAASSVYMIVHVWSFNAMLLMAAGLCGLFWGWMFLRFGSVWPGLISHTIWDLLIFVFWPMQ